jgi:Putative peptidoglycan binding domain
LPRTLRQGDSGRDVSVLQELLNYHLAPLPRVPADSRFGPITDARVRLFQELNDLEDDGIVGQLTREVLLDVRQITFTADVEPPDDLPVTGPATFASRFTPAGITPARFSPSPFLATAAGAAPVGQAAPTPQPVHKQIQIFVGQQANVNPWFLQPMVITGQINWVAKNDGRPDFMLTLGGQVSFNQQNGPSGSWTGQGFAQMGLSGLLKRGNFDLLNPFVVAMIQKNQGQPPSIGLGLGNQMNYNLTPDGFISLFVNGQLVSNVGLNNGFASAPGLQILGGVGFTFDSKP